MSPRKSQQKQQRTTGWTDFCRIILCGLGCFFVGAAVTGYLEEERRWPLSGMIVVVIIGLVFVGVGVFAKPKTVEKAAELINP